MKCAGCGIKLQTADKSLPGYISEAHLEENGEQVYCKRCFDIIHYNLKYDSPSNNDLFLNKMKIIKEKYRNEIIILVVDATDLLGSINDLIISEIGGMKTIILINKIDLLPNSIKINHFETYVKNTCLSKKMNVASVFGISSIKKDNIIAVLKKIDKLRYNKYKNKPNFSQAFVVGVASVGKSTFINCVKSVLKINSLPLTTSRQFQTTQDFIKVELGGHFYLIDTPGVINTKSFKHYLDFESVNIITPKKFMRVRSYQLNAGQTLFLGGLVRLDFEAGENIVTSLFISNDLYVHRTKTLQANMLYENQLLKLLSPPKSDFELMRLKKRSMVSFKLDDDVFYDLMISGIGFIHIKGKGVILNLEQSISIDFKLEKSIL